MIKLQILASGSDGNCYFLQCRETRILIDIGLPCSRIENLLAGIGQDPDSIDAVLVSHEHGDHIHGLAGFTKAHQPRVFGTAGTLSRVRPSLEKINSTFCEIRTDEVYEVGDVAFAAVSVPHDAMEPVGYVLLADSRRMGFFSDLCHIPYHVATEIKDVDLLFLESNYDRDMLDANSSYDARLKARIFANHLSNAQMQGFIREELASTVGHLILGHLSSNNNASEVAYRSAQKALSDRGLNPGLTVVPANSHSEMIQI